MSQSNGRCHAGRGIERLQHSRYGIATSVPEQWGYENLQSCLRAAAGSIRIARRAGIQQPNAAAKSKALDVAISASGSEGETWTSIDFKTWLIASEAVNPVDRPIPKGGIACWNMSFRMPAVVAPIAMRIPISCVRRLTECAITVYRPMDARRRATAAKIRKRVP